ncbi:MAG: hypothetical protein ACRDZ7_09455, partial [Acidimicrobiia bacterium]
DDLLHILHILHGVGSEVRLDWLHEHLSLGEKIDRLRGRIDLESVFEKLGWLEPGSLFTLLGFLGGGAGSATGLLDTDLLDGILDHDGGYEGGGDCGGLVNVCHNANGIVVNDVVDICTVTADNGSFNGPDDDGNADCDVIGDGILGLGDGFGLGQMGDVFGLVGLY